MTPKEKANKLVEKYLNTIIHFPYIDTEDGKCIGTGYMTHLSAKQFALIAVDEFIKDNYYNENIVNGGLNSEYWKEVKQEIEKL